MHEVECFYGSLLFPGRKSLTVTEVARKLNFSVQHIINLIHSGELNALNNSKAPKQTRASLRIPVESYHEFLAARLVHGQNVSPIFDLPEDVQLDIYRRLRSKFKTGEPRA